MSHFVRWEVAHLYFYVNFPTPAGLYQRRQEMWDLPRASLLLAIANWLGVTVLHILQSRKGSLEASSSLVGLWISWTLWRATAVQLLPGVFLKWSEVWKWCDRCHGVSWSQLVHLKYLFYHSLWQSTCFTASLGQHWFQMNVSHFRSRLHFYVIRKPVFFPFDLWDYVAYVHWRVILLILVGCTDSTIISLDSCWILNIQNTSECTGGNWWYWLWRGR